VLPMWSTDTTNFPSVALNRTSAAEKSFVQFGSKAEISTKVGMSVPSTEKIADVNRSYGH